MPAERIEEENDEEGSPDHLAYAGQKFYLATEEESLKTTLRKELGIDSEVDDESPHRFYDWGEDEGKGWAADPGNFLTIED